MGKEKDFWDRLADALSKWWKDNFQSGGGADNSDSNPPHDPAPQPVPPPSTSDIHRASFLFDNAGTRCMNAFGMPEQKFKETVERCRKNGDTVYYAFLNNEKDGNHAGFSPYKDNKIGGEIDRAKVSMMQDRIKYIRENGMAVVLWLRADDSPSFNRASEDAQKTMQSHAAQYFDGLVDGYCLALEWDEYEGDTARMHRYAAHLRQHTDRDIGVHFTSGNKASLANKILGAVAGSRTYYLQYGFGKNTCYVGELTRQVRAELDLNIRLIGCEYNKNSDRKDYAEAILKNGAAGYGNGRA